MLKKKMEEALNEQVKAEMYSANLYFAMGSYFESLSLKGFAKWLRVQGLEELTHAQKFFSFINERGGRAIIKPIDGPPNEWDSPLSVFEEVYKHEVKVTSLIDKLMDIAQEESDYASVNFLQWFVGEQVEEEASADEVVQRLKLVDKTEGGLFLMDQEMGARSFMLPPDLAGLY